MIIAIQRIPNRNNEYAPVRPVKTSITKISIDQSHETVFARPQRIEKYRGLCRKITFLSLTSLLAGEKITLIKQETN